MRVVKVKRKKPFEDKTLTGRSHPRTSFAAANKALPRSGTQRRAVYDAIANARRGLTDDEIVSLLGLSPNSVRPRRVELVGSGLVVDSGRTRENDLGNQCIIWVVRT
jgi:transcription initiation factor IIE alpha subunit